jgi:hypothetical protein
MQKTALALAFAAVLAVAANPALAHCAGSHGKSYRSAKAVKKPAEAKAAQPGNATPAAATTGLDTSTGLAGAAGLASNV